MTVRLHWVKEVVVKIVDVAVEDCGPFAEVVDSVVI